MKSPYRVSARESDELAHAGQPIEITFVICVIAGMGPVAFLFVLWPHLLIALGMGVIWVFGLLSLSRAVQQYSVQRARAVLLEEQRVREAQTAQEQQMLALDEQCERREEAERKEQEVKAREESLRVTREALAEAARQHASHEAERVAAKAQADAEAEAKRVAAKAQAEAKRVAAKAQADAEAEAKRVAEEARIAALTDPTNVDDAFALLMLRKQQASQALAEALEAVRISGESDDHYRAALTAKRHWLTASTEESKASRQWYDLHVKLKPKTAAELARERAVAELVAFGMTEEST